MKKFGHSLQLEQMNKKVRKCNRAITPSPNGWIADVRTSLGMSLTQMGKKLGMSAQGVARLESRERDKTISLKNLDEAARSLGLKLNYSLCAPGHDLKGMINAQAKEKAQEIILQTHRTMVLERQANSRSRIKKAIKEKADQIAKEKPRYLWD